MTYLAEIKTDPALSPLQSAACTYWIALGPRVWKTEIIPDGKKSKLPDTSDAVPYSSASVRINWVRLLKREFDVDI